MTFEKRAPVKIFHFKPGDAAKAHPFIEFSKGWEMSDQPGYEDSDVGFPDRYKLKEGFTVEGNLWLEDGDVVVEYDDGSYQAMRKSLFNSQFKEVKE